MSKCKFNKAWIGICNKECGEDYCEEHKEIKCSICGKQATHDCAETMQLVCGVPLCDSPTCKLQHLYQAHGYAFYTIAAYEEELGKIPFKVVVAHINFGEGDFGETLNRIHKGRFEVMIAVHTGGGTIKFYNANNRYYFKSKEETLKWFNDNVEFDEILREKGLLFGNDSIKTSEEYEDIILNTFEKIA